MEYPAHHDATENRVVTIQEVVLSRAFSRVFRDGRSVGSLVGAGAVGFTSLASLVTAEGFNSFLGMSGPTWEAIFILIFVGSLFFFVVRGFFFLQGMGNGGLGPEAMTKSFFPEETKFVERVESKKSARKSTSLLVNPTNLAKRRKNFSKKPN